MMEMGESAFPGALAMGGHSHEASPPRLWRALTWGNGVSLGAAVAAEQAPDPKKVTFPV
jgi:hypothetical protein